MFGQSAFVGWLAYTAGEKLSVSMGATEESAEVIGLVAGEAACVGTAMVTADPVGLAVGAPLLIARYSGALDGVEDTVDSILRAATNIITTVAGGGGTQPPALP